MALIQTGIWLTVAVLFFVCSRFLLLPVLLKKCKSISLMGISWGISLLFVLFVVLEQGIAYLFGLSVISPEHIYILALTGIGILLMPMLYLRPFGVQFCVLSFICFLGTLALPNTLYGLSNTAGVFVVRMGLAVVWAFFIMLYTEFDRVPIKGFLINIVICLLFLLMSGSMFGLLPDSFFSFWVTILMLLLVLWFIYRKYVFLNLGFPIIFALMYMSGFLFIQLSLMPQGICVLVMLAYPVWEVLRTVFLNIYRRHCVFPIGEMFLSERALALGISPKFILRRIFYVLFLTGVMGIFGMFGSLRYLGVISFFVVLILYQLTISLTRPQSKVTLKSLGKDATMGMKELWREMKNTSSFHKKCTEHVTLSKPKAKKSSVSKDAVD